MLMSLVRFFGSWSTGISARKVKTVSAGDLVSAGGGTGVADGAGAGVAVGEAAGAGVCASAVLPNAIATIGISATRAARKVPIRFISIFSIPIPSGRDRSQLTPAKTLPLLTRKFRFRPMTDASWGLAAPADWPIRHHSPYKAGINWEIP